MDNNLIRAIRNLHSSNSESHGIIRNMLEESLRNKYGSGKEIGPLLIVSPTVQEFSLPVHTIKTGNVADVTDEIETGTSDNELELDLLKEDLMCIICIGMGVGARNRLVECGDCHNLYHQECHNPSIVEEEIEPDLIWICASCKEIYIGLPDNKIVQTPTCSKTTNLNSLSAQVKTFTDQDMPLSPPKSSLSALSITTSNRLLTPNINIISADKRLQIMKKKAAKMQEKRKLSRP